MKYLIFIVTMLLTGCFATTGVHISESKVHTYKCARDLISMKVEASTAIEFCQGTFREDIGDFR